ncbi:expressed protein [Batrachochytrium dendrobatidis JAM81]|uniref:Expressed protein n=2 Tax=Batrachochytrium dendrobatidis TaxID=109871 RepID=F4NY22_BATDJ|nr:uncharacterized protein BATDEDRAFT_87017 [Batrachochytrium dendrobatidis JAM81]EGF82248.1 expressed protein [Batrachochytrium dendrobatidis JAM81]OAJ40678.1 hypothetical protein BDEG_24385 [Batrachochytrium dendrobatidis JEL423]|eukprot:XP_006677679.1 expressed protein [Batrachochytrium dendrobatidis JAM81]
MTTITFNSALSASTSIPSDPTSSAAMLISIADFSLSPASDTDLEHLYTRCSICFDASHDFCLKSCKDQFCRSCFQRYMTEIVRNSWGLSVQNVTCPVCQDPLDLCEWKNYVDQETVRQYKLFNRPFRPMTRTCESCLSEVVCAPQPLIEHHHRERKIDEILSKIEELVADKGIVDSYGFAIISKVRTAFRTHIKGSKSEVFDIYVWFMRDVRDFLNHRPNAIHLKTRSSKLEAEERQKRLSDISECFISLELSSEKWKELQFLHLKSFPQAMCHCCDQSICFSCGQSPYHTGQSCTDCIRDTIADGGSVDVISSLQWKLDNSKQCPNCSVLINRDEGCNKVDCLYCGHKFCWQCLGQFDKGSCAYYRCQLVGVTDESESPKQADEKPEIGVPNMMHIQAKWQRTSMIEI